MQAARRAFVMRPEVGLVKARNGAARGLRGPREDARTGRRRPDGRTREQVGWGAPADLAAGAVDHSAPAAFGVAGGVW